MDLRSQEEVAIKILRNNPLMYHEISFTDMLKSSRRRAGIKEDSILTKIAQKDPEGKHYILKYRGKFEFSGHLCLAFDLMR